MWRWQSVDVKEQRSEARRFHRGVLPRHLHINRLFYFQDVS